MDDRNDMADRRRIDVQQRNMLRLRKAAPVADAARTLSSPGAAVASPGAYRRALLGLRSPTRGFGPAMPDPLAKAAPYGPYRKAGPVPDALLEAIMEHESGALRGRRPGADFMPNADLGLPTGRLLGDRIKGAPDDGRPSHYAAWGPMQTHRGVVDDVNRVYGTKYRYIDRALPGPSMDMARRYIGFWSGRGVYLDGEGRLRVAGRGTPMAARPKPSPETFARIWNGGPLGPNKPATDSYADSVMRIMERLRHANN